MITHSAAVFIMNDPCLRSKARAMVASMYANWSPTHFLAPPPKGMKAKSDDTSLGYRLDV